MRSLVLVVLGGAFGTLCRYGVNESLPHDGLFPLSTFVVNVVGSFVLGALLALLLARGTRGEPLRLLFGTGFLGGFTTYSALAVETDALLRGDHVVLGLGYAFGSVLAGIAAALAGVAAASKARR